MIGNKKNQFEMLSKDFIFEFKQDLTGTNKSIYKLTLSWLRNGIRPLIRYNTNDLFLKIDNDFVPIGRGGVDSNIIVQNYLFDDELFNIPVIIFDYILNFKTKEMNLVVIEDEDEDYINSLIKPIIKKFYKISDIEININSSENEFLKFSPRVKSKRFVYD